MIFEFPEIGILSPNCGYAMNPWNASALTPPGRVAVQPSTDTSGPRHESYLHEADRLLAESRRLVAKANEILQHRTLPGTPSRDGE